MRTLAIALALLSAAPAAAREIAITFDDLPVHAALPPGVTRLQVAQEVIAALKAAGVPEVYGFINAVALEREPGTDVVLKAWRDAGFPLELVQQVVRLVERSEYKRQQAAPVLKVTSKSFGMGRRFPIAVKVQV